MNVREQLINDLTHAVGYHHMRRIPSVETPDAIRLTDATNTALGKCRQHIFGCKKLALLIEEVTIS